MVLPFIQAIGRLPGKPAALENPTQARGSKPFEPHICGVLGAIDP